LNRQGAKGAKGAEGRKGRMGGIFSRKKAQKFHKKRSDAKDFHFALFFRLFAAEL
jgi:hypothetical protein